MMLLTVSIVTFSLFGYYHYQATLDKYKDKQLLQLELFASSVESLLKGQESLLEVVGHQLVEQNSFTRTAAIQTRPMLDKLLNIHPAIIGFGLTNPNGDYISVSSNLILEKLHNLKQDPLTRETFLEALNSDRMVIGRTYFMEAQDSLVIPIRKAIPDKNGVVQAVMTAGFNMNTSSVFRNDIHANEHNRVSLIRNDGYLTFSSSEDTTIKDYQKPADDLNKQALLDQIQQDYGWDTDQVKQLTRAINVVVDTQRLNELITLKYLPDYGLWAASSTDLGFIKRGFYSQFAFYCIVFLIVQAAFYALFRSIANNEHETKERLLYQACHDHLTRLPNREYLRSNIQRWMCGSSNPFTLMFIDIDNFKSVNDTHGHEFGDEVLKQISTRLNHFSGEGRLIVREASDEFIFIVNRTDEPIQMSINISVKQFLHAKFIERLMAAMDKYHLDCNRITLEITENLFIEDLEKFSPTCERLHALGFKISLDDFGTGYSSLSMLRTLPIDEVKIDKSFVDNIEHDKKALNMVKNIIAIGKNFEMKVLAEGVETQRQRDQLEACGCDLIQGYFYSKPLSFDQLVSFVKDNKEEKAIID